MDTRFASTTAQLGLGFMRNVTPMNENVVLSPVSLQIILNLILLGSETNSNTEHELLKLLSYDKLGASSGKSDKKASDGRLAAHQALHEVVEQMSEAIAHGPEPLNFDLANLVLTNADRAKLNPEYSNEMKRFYSNIKLEEFATSSVGKPLADRINGWVASTTRNQITQLVDESQLNADLALVLLNAAYFKGKWLKQFQQEQTRDGPFYNLGGNGAKQVKFMHQKGLFAFADLSASLNGDPNNTDMSGPELEHLRLAEKLDCRAISLPFSLNKGEELDMVFVLPNKRDGLANLVANLTPESLNMLLQKLEEKTQIQVSLPLFTFESAHDAKEILKSMGLSRIFSDEAELGRMLFPGKSPGIFVSQLLHKAKIIVDESGAEAAAATTAVAAFRSLLWLPQRPFVADRPFLFLIRHKPTSMLLFLGLVNKL